jgi:hypothetical protein
VIVKAGPHPTAESKPQVPSTADLIGQLVDALRDATEETASLRAGIRLLREILGIGAVVLYEDNFIGDNRATS